MAARAQASIEDSGAKVEPGHGPCPFGRDRAALPVVSAARQAFPAGGAMVTSAGRAAGMRGARTCYWSLHAMDPLDPDHPALDRRELRGWVACCPRDPDCRRFLRHVRPGHPHQDEILFRTGLSGKSPAALGQFWRTGVHGRHTLHRGHGLYPHAAAAGTHNVTVTREGEGIYRLAGSGRLLFASRCSTLALRGEAVLQMQDSLSGILHLHGDTCRVEDVFEAISYRYRTLVCNCFRGVSLLSA